jgi:AcrR family transcriptional regulator
MAGGASRSIWNGGNRPLRIATMAKAKIRPSPALMQRVERAFLDHGYAELSMRGLAAACDFSTRALYHYFSNKEEAFRASVRFQNDVALAAGFAAGRAQRANGGSALDILAEIMNVRFGETRRKANASRHVIELSAEVFKRCSDIVTEVALLFEEDLAKLLAELEEVGLLRLRAGAPEEVAQALANGARGVNQRLPPVAPDDLARHYREMCAFILYGCADLPAMHPAAHRPLAREHRETEQS